MALSVVILAAGQGQRMHSALPKVLHTLAGKPLLGHVIDASQHLTAEPPIVVYGFQGELLRAAFTTSTVQWVEQASALGTGHAVLQTIDYYPDDNQVLILYGDVPCISLTTLEKFIAAVPKDSLGIITAVLPDPTGFGRIMRDDTQQITRIVEEKDADEKQKQINEINSGIYLIPARYLKTWLPQIKNNNAQQEFYLTDIISLAKENNIAIHSFQADPVEEILGVNNREQLAMLERYFQQRLAAQLLQQGVTLKDPARFDVRGELTVGQDVTIDVNCIFVGKVHLSDFTTVGANCFLRDVYIGRGVDIKPNTILEEATIGDQCSLGPFARVRPGTVLQTAVHIGNFVEVKNSFIDVQSKVNHLSYIGDCDMGKKVNIGAGTITCNYDGVNKHRTTIKDNVFVGSDSQLVAPVTIAEGATIGAGSTITRNAPAHQLTLTRSPQKNIANWKKPEKKEG